MIIKDYMKHIFQVSITSLFFASCLFTSCIEDKQSARGLQFDEIKISCKEHLFADESKPACNLSISLAYVSHANTTETKDSLNAYLLSAALDNNYQHSTPQEAVDSYAKEYIKNYRSDLEPMLKKDIESNINNAELKTWYNYEHNIEGSIETYNKNLFTYRTYQDNYSGGAHGMHDTKFINIDLSDLHLIELDELFVGDYQETLTELLWYQLALDNQVESRNELEEMGYATTGDLTPIENFYLTKNGISFYYNVYEIAPYAMGAIQITLSYDMLQYILNYDSPIIKEFTTQWN